MRLRKVVEVHFRANNSNNDNLGDEKEDVEEGFAPQHRQPALRGRGKLSIDFSLDYDDLDNTVDRHLLQAYGWC